MSQKDKSEHSPLAIRGGETEHSTERILLAPARKEMQPTAKKTGTLYFVRGGEKLIEVSRTSFSKEMEKKGKSDSTEKGKSSSSKVAVAAMGK